MLNVFSANYASEGNGEKKKVFEISDMNRIN